MNILILDSGNTFNYGSMMMAENLIYYSEKINNGNTYYVDSHELIHVERLRKATDIDNIFMIREKELFSQKYKKNEYRYIAKLFGKKDIQSEFMKSIDRVYFLGGDDFTQIYGYKQLLKCLLDVNLIKDDGTYVALVGQSIGPFDRWLELIANKIFKNMDLISLRDPRSYKSLSQKGLNNIKFTTDLALLPLAKETQKVYNEKKYILVCPSEIMYMYAQEKDRNKFIQLNKKMCEHILKKYNNIKLIMLPHVTRDRTGGDGKMLNDIYEAINEKYKSNIIKIEKEVLPYEVRDLIKQSKFIVAERMHPAISGLECETPSVVFSYGRKYEGIFEILYDLKKTVLDVRKYKDYDVMWNDLKNIIDYIDENRENLIEKIKLKNKETQKIVMDHIKELNGVK